MPILAVVQTGSKKYNLQDHFNIARSGNLFPENAKIEFVKQVHNKIGVSGSWCGNDAGYHPWVIIKINGVEHLVSTYYLTEQ